MHISKKNVFYFFKIAMKSKFGILPLCAVEK